MLSTELKQKVVDRVTDLLALATKKYDINFPRPSIEFLNMGVVAGRWQRSAVGTVLSFNPEIYLRNIEHFLNTTVPHEVAHLVAFTMFPYCKAHGEEWKHIYTGFGVPLTNVTRCHSYNLKGIPRQRVVKRHYYKCNCKTHEVSTTLHNRIKADKNNTSRCRECNSGISYTKTIDLNTY